MNINQQLAQEFNLKPVYADNIIALIDEGNTIPFIARYRKEMHGGCDDEPFRLSQRVRAVEKLVLPYVYRGRTDECSLQYVDEDVYVRTWLRAA